MQASCKNLEAKLAKAQNVSTVKIISMKLRDLNVLKAMVLSCASHKHVSTLVESYESVCGQYHTLWLLSALVSPDELRTWQRCADTAYDITEAMCLQYKCDFDLI